MLGMPLYALPFRFEYRWRDGNARDRSLIGTDVLTTPSFGPFFKAAGAQLTNKPWHADPLTLTVVFSYLVNNLYRLW